MQKARNALEISKNAKNNTFNNCEIYGGVKIAGTGTRMIKTRIYQFKKAHPFVWWVGVIASIIAIIEFLTQVL